MALRYSLTPSHWYSEIPGTAKPAAPPFKELHCAFAVY